MTHPSGPRSDRPPRWAIVGLPAVLAGLIAVVVATYLVIDDGRSADTPPGTTRSTGSAVPPSELVGEWTGDGAVAHCAGFDDADCQGTRTVTLTIDCSGKRCRVTPFDAGYGHPPLRFEDGSYRAAGPVPAKAAPTCGGSPTTTALWHLDVAVIDGRLDGSYAESTIQGFDCGATDLTWTVSLQRS